MKLTITDSCLNGDYCLKEEEKEVKKEKIALAFQAIDNLQKEFKENKVEIISFVGQSRKKENFENQPIIWYGDIKTEKFYARYTPIEAKFYTSHYVGFYSTVINNQPVTIEIEPRFGKSVQNYLFAHALELYLPKGDSGQEKSSSDNLWLMALLWRAMVEKAITKSQIPKTYQKIDKNQSYFRGRLNVAKQIKYNLIDQSKFYCNYSKLSYNNKINQTVRYCYYLLKKYKCNDAVKGFAEYDAMLNDFGVSNQPVEIKDIQNIHYTPMTKYYKPLMELSKNLIAFKHYQNTSNLQKKSFSMFIDMAEIWENYIYNLLRKKLPSEYEIENPNLTGDYALFDDESRKVRPDILIKKGSEVIAVIDAKYKRYTCIGENAKVDGAVSREDLYQMMTYLCRFGKTNTFGIFVSPKKAEDFKTLKDSQNQQIGVLGIKLPLKEEKEDLALNELQKSEKSFVESLLKHLNYFVSEK
jgi:5-methylcytosine-specific restriction enzyme subunit McrC